MGLMSVMIKFTSKTIPLAKCPNCHSRKVTWSDDLIVYCEKCSNAIGTVTIEADQDWRSVYRHDDGKKYDSEKPEVLLPRVVFEEIFNRNSRSPYLEAMREAVLVGAFAGHLPQDMTYVQWRFTAVAAAEEVLQHGKKKYGADNWQKLRNFKTRYHAAIVRHSAPVFHTDLPPHADTALTADDKDSGLPHWKHVVCNCVFLLWNDIKDRESSTANTE